MQVNETVKGQGRRLFAVTGVSLQVQSLWKFGSAQQQPICDQ